MSENHYEVLGVDPDASRDQLRDAYRARVDELTAARDRKGITDSQLEANRDEVARVRTAWNVLSDPFQRQRYDAQVVADDTVSGGDVEVVDDDTERPDVQLTGWRRLMAPPPQKAASAGGRGGAGSNGAAAPPRAKEPTIPVPAGMQIASSRARGMAFLFDFSVVLVIFYAASIFLPQLVQSDFKAVQSQGVAVSDAKSAQSDINDAQSAVKHAQTAVAKAENSGTKQELTSAQNDLKSAQNDLKSARSDFADAQKSYTDHRKDSGFGPATLPHDTGQLDDLATKLSDEIRTSTYIGASAAFVLCLAYLVPMTAITGSTFGMKRRGVKVIRVDGSPAGWWPSFVRFALPLAVGIAGTVTLFGILGVILAFGMVLWGYRDANGQGLHDKLARTLVVET